MPADQFAATETVLDATDDPVIVANLGVSAYVLADIEDRDRNYYMRGAMGCTTPTGLGLAVSLDDPVVVFDGDGSMLMSLGCLTTVGRYAPDNLVIVVWDNREYATTGGQPTSSDVVDFAAVAEDCGLAGFRAGSDDEFESAYRDALDADGPALVAARVERADASPPEWFDYGHSYMDHRFREAVSGE